MSPLTLHAQVSEDRRPLHVRRVHPTPVEGCFGCKAAAVALVVPPYMRAGNS